MKYCSFGSVLGGVLCAVTVLILACLSGDGLGMIVAPIIWGMIGAIAGFVIGGVVALVKRQEAKRDLHGDAIPDPLSSGVPIAPDSSEKTRTAELEKRIAALEQQVIDLKKR